MRIAERTRPANRFAAAAGPQPTRERVSSVASGRQAKRTGAYGEVPRPADTSSQAASGGRLGARRRPAPGHHRESPLARPRSRSQLVTSAP